MRITSEPARAHAGSAPTYATLLALAWLVAVSAPLRAVNADPGEPDAAAAPQKRQTQVHDPAATFAKRLDLDAKQQAQVSRLLAMRREQIHKVWSDPAIAASDRVGAVKAVNEKTIEQIRALLTEEQKQKYFQPRPAQGPPPAAGPSESEWLNKTLSPPNSDASPPH
ncbi:MAG: hypothetical protein JOZ67_01220 [Gammaproteobacteria bacterium]|nr:hypothetical protein [Gammaproteobacteria bacterium]MBV9696393.1 hypothetical protein [Gammaproteobacteria bacterium]